MYITLTSVQNGEPVGLAQTMCHSPSWATGSNMGSVARTLSAGELEIALCELTYYHWWYNICGAKKNNKVSRGRTDRIIPDGYYNVCELNEKVFKRFDAELTLDEPSGLLKLTIKPGDDLTMNRELANLLGFKDLTFKAPPSSTRLVRVNGVRMEGEDGIKTFTAEKPHKLAVHREVYFHLAEFTSDNLHNGRPSTLLRSIPVENEKCGAGRTESFPVLQYKRLLSGPISQLTISLRDINGEMLPFEYMSATLHVRNG